VPTRHLLLFLEHQFEHRGCGVGPHCCFCGTFTGPFSEIEGLFTVLICIPCLEVRLAQRDTLLGSHDPQPASGAVGLPDQRLRPLGPQPLGPGVAHRGQAPGLDRHLPATAAVSEPAPAGRVPPQCTTDSGQPPGTSPGPAPSGSPVLDRAAPDLGYGARRAGGAR
jgi:hypothetical protein